MTNIEFLEELKSSVKGTTYLDYLESHGNFQDIEHEQGYEVHHICPKSLGGDNTRENLVKLSTYDHIVAHYLLALAMPCDQTIAALYYVSNAQIKNLSNVEQIKLEDLEQWSVLRERGLKRSVQRRLAKSQSLESRARRKKTCIERYGNICGAMHTPERKAKAIKHSLESRNRLYGDNGAGAMHTKEAVRKSKESLRKTIEERYGGKPMVWCHTEEVKQKALESRIRKYGAANGGAMTPEACAKRESGKRRKMTVVRTPEFEQWFQKNYLTSGKKRSWVVTEFLNEVGRSLNEYEEYQK